MSENDLSYPGGKLRLYAEASLAVGARVAPDDRQTHLLQVLGAKTGDRLLLFNGRAGEWLARVAAVSDGICSLECDRRIAVQSEVPDIWLCFAPIEKTPSDYLVQKATELGVRRLQPVITRNTIAACTDSARLRAAAIAAAEQSGRLSIPQTPEPVTLDELLAGWSPARRLIFCDEGGDARPIAQALAAEPDQPFAVLTGPEGGFHPAERAALRGRSFVIPVTLGPRILRADTAALAALAIWQAVKGDWR